MADAAPMTDEELAQMEQTVAAEKARRAAEAAAARATKLKPLTDLLTSDAWAQLRAQIGAAATAAIGEPFYDQFNAIDRLSGMVADQVFATLPIPFGTSA